MKKGVRTDNAKMLSLEILQIACGNWNNHVEQIKFGYNCHLHALIDVRQHGNQHVHEQNDDHDEEQGVQQPQQYQWGLVCAAQLVRISEPKQGPYEVPDNVPPTFEGIWGEMNYHIVGQKYLGSYQNMLCVIRRSLPRFKNGRGFPECTPIFPASHAARIYSHTRIYRMRVTEDGNSGSVGTF